VNSTGVTPSASACLQTLVATNGGKIFTIDSSSSTASFTIKEVLFGNPNTVVGTTHQVAGQILVNAQTPAKSQVGEIRMDVSALVTDNPLRNRTLQNRILATGTPANQYATFVPTALTGLPTSIAVRKLPCWFPIFIRSVSPLV